MPRLHHFCCLIFTCGLFVSINALAWGDAGHKAIGAIAARLIEDSNASRQVDALLFKGENLAQISVWVDCIKGRFCNVQAEEINSYVAANPKHNEYHYTDIPYQLNAYHDGGVGTHDSDIVQIMKQAISVLQGNANSVSNPHQFTQRQALLLIVHLMGDLHQPLHVGAGYVAKYGQFIVPENSAQIDGHNISNTYGANSLLLDEKMRPARRPKTDVNSLHTYWDTTVINNAMYRLNTKSPIEFAKLLAERNANVTNNVGNPIYWPYQWANDTLTVAKLAYADVAPKITTQMTGRNGEILPAWIVSLPEGYEQRSSTLAEQQIIKAGYRLAALLKAIWP